MPDLHKCDNCSKVFTDDTLPKSFEEIPDLHQRLDPGGEVPSGECECGALTYLARCRLCEKHVNQSLGYHVSTCDPQDVVCCDCRNDQND